MKKIVVSLAIIFVLFLVLLIALIVFLPRLVDTQTFRTELTEQVKSLTGQDLSINGDLSVSVFPWLGISTGEIVLSQPPSVGLDEAPLLSVQQANISVKFLPLLQKQIEVSEIRFIAPSITYIETENGSTSLDGLSKSDTPSSTEPASSNSASANGFNPAAIVIAGITITDGQLVMDNRAAGEIHRIDDLTFSTGNLLSGTEEALAFNANVIPHAQDPIAVDLNSLIQLDINTQTVALSALELTVEQHSLNAQMQIDKVDASADTIDLNALEMNINTADLLPVTLEPQIAISRANFDFVNNVSDVIPFSISENNTGLNTTGDIQLELDGDNVLYKGGIAVDELVPLAIMKLFAVDYQAASEDVLQTFGLSTTFNGSNNGISINNLTVQLDESRIEANLAMVDFAQPRYNFVVNLNRMNLDDYLPPVVEDENSNATSDADASALLLPIAVFKDLNANGVFNADFIQASGVKLEALSVDIASTDNTVKITPAASLYEGSIAGSVTYRQVSAERSTLNIAPQFTNVQFGDLLTDADITDLVSGKGSLDINVDVTDVNGKQTNQGTIGFLINDGAVKNIDIQKSLYKAQDSLDSLRGKAPRERSATSNETRFAEAVGTFNLDNFLLTNNDLQIKAPAFRVNGQGTINIETQLIDYATNVSIVKTSKGQGGKELSDLEGLTIPVTISGSFEEPKPSVDIKSLVQANTKNDVDKKVQEKREELIEDTKKKILNRFFN